MQSHILFCFVTALHPNPTSLSSLRFSNGERSKGSFALSSIFQPLEHCINFQVFGPVSEILLTFRPCLPFPLGGEETGLILPTPVFSGWLSFLCSIVYSPRGPTNLTLFASRNFLTELWELASSKSEGQAGDSGKS